MPPILATVLFELPAGDGKRDLRLVGADGFMLCVQRVPVDVSEMALSLRFPVDTLTVRWWVKLLREDARRRGRSVDHDAAELSFDVASVGLTLKDSGFTVLSARVYGKYPDHEKLIPTDLKTHSMFALAPALTASVSRMLKRGASTVRWYPPQSPAEPLTIAFKDNDCEADCLIVVMPMFVEWPDIEWWVK